MQTRLIEYPSVILNKLMLIIACTCAKKNNPPIILPNLLTIDEKTFPKKIKKTLKNVKSRQKLKKNVCKRWKNVTSVIFRRTDKFDMPIGNRPSKTKLKATIKLRLNYRLLIILAIGLILGSLYDLYTVICSLGYCYCIFCNYQNEM